MPTSANSKLASVDQEIYSCLDRNDPKSFFLFAGAGSGKTGSLVRVLQEFRQKDINRLRNHGQQLAVITYTNAACDEIKRRLEFDPAFWVSTIHSFCWGLINPYQEDIRQWIENELKQDLEKLRQAQAKGRPNTKTAIDRARKIEIKNKRLEHLSHIRVFSYNPNGLNSGRDSLNHAEVIKLTSQFLETKKLLQQILVRKYPILFVDESQDTKKELIDAFFKIQRIHSREFSLGLFGDMMQRIYTDGKAGLGENLPTDWLKPQKNINYRCPKRVISLINDIRENQFQKPSKHNPEGFVRLFIVDIDSAVDKGKIEKFIMESMAKITDDEGWLSATGNKVLTLEHKMAARRGQFIDFFQPLYDSKHDTTGLLDGTMTGIPFLTKTVLPLIQAVLADDEFAVTTLMKDYSPILDSRNLFKSDNQLSQIKNAQNAIKILAGSWKSNKDQPLSDMLKQIYQLNALSIPDIFLPIVQRTEVDEKAPESDEEERNLDLDAWNEALSNPFSQLAAYKEYISDRSRFGTHQGVKGLQFPRVMVILDDSESGMNLFSYDKLFGAKSLSDTDIRNAKEGKETTLDRTRRLFYVTCSRAEQSLAIVAYTPNPEMVRKFASRKWFNADEIIDFSPQ